MGRSHVSPIALGVATDCTMHHSNAHLVNDLGLFILVHVIRDKVFYTCPFCVGRGCHLRFSQSQGSEPSGLYSQVSERFSLHFTQGLLPSG